MQKDREQTGSDDQRRNFMLEMATFVIGGIASLVPVVIGLVTFFDPFRRKRVPTFHAKSGDGGNENEVFVTRVSALPDNGLPQRFTVIADKIDGWNFITDQPIGSVYLSLQKEDGAKDKVIAFNTTCPHAGCSVSYDGASEAYQCPCHNSSFTLDGARRDQPGKENPSPRDLDRLEVNQQKLDESGEVWIQFMNFYTGREEQKPKQ